MLHLPSRGVICIINLCSLKVRILFSVKFQSSEPKPSKIITLRSRASVSPTTWVEGRGPGECLKSPKWYPFAHEFELNTIFTLT